MKLNFDDNSRTAIIIFINALIPLLTAMGILHWDKETSIAFMAVVSLGITMLSRLIRTGQGVDPTTTANAILTAVSGMVPADAHAADVQAALNAPSPVFPPLTPEDMRAILDAHVERLKEAGVIQLAPAPGLTSEPVAAKSTPASRARTRGK